MDRTATHTPQALGRVVPLVVGLAAGLALGALVPAQGGLVGPGVLAVAFALAAFTGLSKTSSA